MKKSKLQTLMKSQWANALYPYFQTNSFVNLSLKIAEDRETTEVYPKRENIFRVFNETDLQDVKVVLLGDSPSNITLHDDSPIANGRCYGISTLTVSPEESIKLYEELGEPLGFDFSLQHLVDQNVLLFNCKLTSTKLDKDAHVEWYDFTRAVIEALNKQDGITVVFRAESSKQFKSLITNKTITLVDSIKDVTHVNWQDSPSNLSATTQYFNHKDIKIKPYDGQGTKD